MGGTLAPAWAGGNRGPKIEKAAGGRVTSTPYCLFPREQGATGMNSAVLTASLTGRIQFFYCVALLRVSINHYCVLLATSSICVHPPFTELLPRGFTEHLRGSASRRE
jgi:hypothetical protein